MSANGKNRMANMIFRIPQDAFSANPKSFQVVVHNRIMNNSVSMTSPRKIFFHTTVKYVLYLFPDNTIILIGHFTNTIYILFNQFFCPLLRTIHQTCVFFCLFLHIFLRFSNSFTFFFC